MSKSMSKSSPTRIGLLFAWLALAAAAAGCDAAADFGYPGEPLYTIHGRVEGGDANASSKVALFWVNPRLRPDPDHVILVDVAGQFPAGFSLPLYAPPRPEVFIDGVEVAIAYLLVYEKNTRDYFARRSVIGVAGGHAVVYVSRQVEPGTRAAELLHGTPDAGYHLMKLVEQPRRAHCLPDDFETCPPPLSELHPLESPADETVGIEIPERKIKVRFPTIAF